MSACLLAARLPDRPEALERLLGMIRRRALPVERVSVARCSDGSIEVILRHNGEHTHRIRSELSLLFDVEKLASIPEERALGTRELVVVRVGNKAVWPDVHLRVLEEGPSESVFELTGTPAELDDVLSSLDSQGVLARSVRSGEILFPVATSSRKVEQDQ